MCCETKIYAFDIVSLYPIVNALDDYAVGFGRYTNDLTINHIINYELIGIVKVDIEPPKDLRVPVLPERKDGKSLSDLTNKFEK